LSFQLPQTGEGNAAIAAGASLARCTRSGDLPPRRVYARIRFRFDQYLFQPNTIDTIAGLDNGFVPISVTPVIFPISRFSDNSKI